MKSLLAKVLRRDSALPDQALVGVLFHKSGILFEPHERRLTQRGPTSNEAMPPDTWQVLAADADTTALGEAALSAFDRIRTVKGRKEGRWGRPGYADELRGALGLTPRAALWTAAGKVTLSVQRDTLSIRPMRPEGAAGGFVFLTDHGIPAIAQSDLTADRLGAALAQARDLVLPRR